MAKDEELEFCNRLLEKHLQNPLAIYLLQSLKNAGCPLRRSDIRCKPSGAFRIPKAGDFDPREGITIYSSNLQASSQVVDTLCHELIHAFDYCRARVDPKNIQHVACTEIRAAALSGDCRWTREVMRGVLGWTIRGKFEECIKRRAMLAMQEQFGADETRAAVDRVYETCLSDTAPFIDIP